MTTSCPTPHTPTLDRTDTQGLVDLGEMALTLGMIQRVTRHSDGITIESDTTHTVMLALLAGTLRDRWYPWLDFGRVLWASLAHDLVEVVVGDTPTWGITPEQRVEKALREQHGAHVLAARFGTVSPRLVQAILDYENQATPEDRFVKTLDKVLPKITHLANEGVVLRSLSSRQEADRRWAEQRAEMAATYAAEFPLLLDLHSALADEVRQFLHDDTPVAKAS